MNETTNSSSKVVISSSQCIGMIARIWNVDATVVRKNAHSLRVQRVGALRAETFRFCKVLSSGQSLYRGGVNEIIKF